MDYQKEYYQNHKEELKQKRREIPKKQRTTKI